MNGVDVDAILHKDRSDVPDGFLEEQHAVPRCLMAVENGRRSISTYDP